MKKIPKEHQMKCNNCGQIMDMRDLGQVFAHEECNGIPINYEKMNKKIYSSSRKKGSPELNIKEKGKTNLN